MQQNLFGDIEPAGITIDEAADKINVSSATIRNWLKTGYLKQIKKGIVEVDSLQQFTEEVAGKDKLVKRANKLMKDEHDHQALSELVRNKLAEDDWVKIGQQYEGSLSNSYRNKEGIYYTPTDIIDDMLTDIKPNAQSTFLDPCCGSGNFILQAVKAGIKPENVYGFDIDPNAVEITRKRILAETGFDAKNNILQTDFLESALKPADNQRYDFIFTNPPWGKKLKKKEKERFAGLYKAGRSTDTTSLFCFAAMGLLKPDGYLGFLVQDALFNISVFQATRTNILRHRLIRITDYGKPFKGLLTKACAFIIQKNKEKSGKVICSDTQFVHGRKQNTFQQNPKSILNFWTKEEENQVINHLYRLPHTTLTGKAKWGLGIVTGNNAKFCQPLSAPHHVPVFKGSDITEQGLKSPSNYIPDDFSKYQQVAPLALYNSPQKLIYKFISSKLVFFCDTEQRYILNSANFVIPDAALDISCQQLADMLSSKLMNWLFSALFNTHKVLRGDLEMLPLHTDYFKENSTFSEESYLKYLQLTTDKNGAYRVKK